jgi:hypothetical protein
MSIDELIAQGEAIYETKHLVTTYIGENSISNNYIKDSQAKCDWEMICLMFLRNNFPGHPEISKFENLCASKHGPNSLAKSCLQQISILKAFAAINPAAKVADYDSILSNIFDKFQKVEQQLARRHDNRETLRIKDEYDVQNLLHALLKLHFEDIRAEEYTPSYAGSSKRMDFLLNDDQVVIEIKMTRDGLKDKKVGEELTIDIAHYKSHPKCKKMYCFVYDKDCLISNPRGLEKDLGKQSTPEMAVRVFIRP